MQVPRWIIATVVAAFVALVILVAVLLTTGRLFAPAPAPSPVVAQVSFYDNSSLGHWVKNPACPSGTSYVDLNAGGLDNERTSVVVESNFDRYGVGENPVVRSDTSAIVAVIPMKFIPADITGVQGDYWGFWLYEAPGTSSRLLLEHARVSSDQTLRVCIR